MTSTGYHWSRLTAVWRLLAVVFVSLCLPLGCAQQSPARSELPVVQTIRPQCGLPSNADIFFPVRTFSNSDHDGSVLRRAYSTYLTAMRESSLSCGETPEEAYRLLVIHPFKPEPRAIRVSRTGKVYSLVATSLSDGGMDRAPVAITNQANKALTSEEWHTLVSALERASFWTRPTDPVRPSTTGSFDGVTWILEGRRGLDYHVVTRRPEPEQGMSDVGVVFFKLAGLDIR